MAIEVCAFCGKEFDATPESFASGKTGEPVCPDPTCQAEQGAVSVVTFDD